MDPSTSPTKTNLTGSRFIEQEDSDVLDSALETGLSGSEVIGTDLSGPAKAPKPFVKPSTSPIPVAGQSFSVSSEIQPTRPAPPSPAESTDTVVPSSSAQSAVSSDPSASDPQSHFQPSLHPPPAPHRRQSKPKKGILKPPPPPPRQGLFGGKLRDALGSIHPRVFDYQLPSPSGLVGGSSNDDFLPPHSSSEIHQTQSHSQSHSIGLSGPGGEGEDHRAGNIGGSNIAAGGATGTPAGLGHQVGHLASGVIGGVGAVGEAVGGAAAGFVGTWGSKLGKIVAGQQGQGQPRSGPDSVSSGSFLSSSTTTQATPVSESPGGDSRHLQGQQDKSVLANHQSVETSGGGSGGGVFASGFARFRQQAASTINAAALAAQNAKVLQQHQQGSKQAQSPFLTEDKTLPELPLTTSASNSRTTEKELPDIKTSPPDANPIKLTFASSHSPFSLQQPTAATSNSRPLKRASFILPAMTITYPISASASPWSDKVTQDRKLIEKTAKENWGRNTGKDYWTRERLVGLYESACKGREEPVRVGLRWAIAAAAPPAYAETNANTPQPRHLLLSSDANLPPSAFSPNEQTDRAPNLPFKVEATLNKHVAESLADVLSLEWGLARLTLEGGILSDEALKPILHALLVSGTLPYLSLAGNKKIKPAGWRLVSDYLKQARTLKYLDISDNILDKRSVEYLMSALVVGVQLPAAEAALDGTDTEEADDDEYTKSMAPMFKMVDTDGPAVVQTLKMDNCSLRAASLERLGQSIRRSDIKNLSLRRNKINALGAVAVAVMLRDYPDAAVSTNRLSPESLNLTGGKPNETKATTSVAPVTEPEKLGRLVTLDVRTNDIKGGVSYIAQVLKRNKTLKVLNLSDNKIDVAGLVNIAEALRQNTTLETLDMSSNPCCGPNLDGIHALKSALMVNKSLKRIFLSNTSMTAEGAIALAETIPDIKTIIHLDLTDNSIGEAGLMALNVAMKANTTLRCVDVSVPSISDDGQVEQARQLLQTCITNTERALQGRGDSLSQAAKDAIWAPLRKSVVLKQAREAEEAKTLEQIRRAADTPAGVARNVVFTMKPDVVLVTAEDSAEKLLNARVLLESSLQPSEKENIIVEVEKTKALLDRIADMIQDTQDPERLERLLALNDLLIPLVADVQTALAAVPQRRRPLSTDLQAVFGDRLGDNLRPSINTTPNRRHMRAPSLEITSPNFSIGGSDDDDSDAEEFTPKSSAYPARLARAAPPALKLQTTDSVKEASGVGEGWPSRDEVASPLERVNKEWIAEEGEVFRKGQKLGVADDDDDQEEGFELKQKILASPVLDSFPALDSDDDWLEDDGGVHTHYDQGSHQDPLVNQEYEKLKSKYEDAGYREGIEPGKLSTLQEGFDTAFAASVAPSRHLGQLRGRTSVLLSLCNQSSETSEELTQRIRALQSTLNKIKRNDILPPDLEAEAHAREEHPEDFAESIPAPTSSITPEKMLVPFDGLREDALLQHMEKQVLELEQAFGL